MRFVFLALMCVFAGIHAARGPGNTGAKVVPSDFWDAAGSLFFSIAASLMFVLVAVGSRTGVKHQTYYVLILVGLCISLASDILLAFAIVPRKVISFNEDDSAGTVRTMRSYRESGRNFTAAGLSFSAAAGAMYTCAFYSYAAFSWYEAAFFAVLAALVSAAMYNIKRDIFKSAPRIIFILVLCAVSAKALSLLFEHNKTYIYAGFAAAGTVLFSVSNVMSVSADGKKSSIYNITKILLYYTGQALIALSVMI